MGSILPFVEGWNPHIEPAVLAGRLEEMLPIGYRCIGAFDGETMVAIAGFWTGCAFWCGNFIEPDNVIVQEDRRGQGIGKSLLDWIHAEGRRLGCDVSVLDSYLKLVDSHRFYEGLGYEKPGYHFLKRL
jgi:GNAT superfamily N-acetyltransferase